MDFHNFGADLEKENKEHIKSINKTLIDWKKMPVSKQKKLAGMRENLELWKRMYEGDTDALLKLSVMRGLMTQEDYDRLMNEEEEDF